MGNEEYFTIGTYKLRKIHEMDKVQTLPTEVRGIARTFSTA